MAELKTLSTSILVHIAKELNIPMRSLLAAVSLLDEGGTVPFIARYRKEATGNLDEVAIRVDRREADLFPRIGGTACDRS